MRHHQSEHLHQTDRELTQIPEAIHSDVSKWKVEIVPGTELINLDEHEVRSSDMIKQIVTEWKEVPDTHSENDEQVQERLSFQYEYKEAVTERAKQSVTEIKRRQETMDEYSDNRIIKPFRAPLVKQPIFMQKIGRAHV